MDLTLGIPVRDNRLLLGLKKRGFGAGRWNGFGGKAQEGESIEECLKRECREEAGIKIMAAEKRGLLEFVFPDRALTVHLYWIQDFAGEPAETEEMNPKWFKIAEIPFTQMWPDDHLWFPYFLDGKKFTATFRFLDQDTVTSYTIKETSGFDQ